jgi:hypothetical protein
MESPNNDQTTEDSTPPTGSDESETSSIGANTLGNRFDLDGVIRGLASDLANLRAGKISIEQARTSADVARQFFNGVRIVVNVQSLVLKAAKSVNSLPTPERAKPEGGEVIDQ